jgi:hypothetical protein
MRVSSPPPPSLLVGEGDPEYERRREERVWERLEEEKIKEKVREND